jgi:uncharacterized protein YegL
MPRMLENQVVPGTTFRFSAVRPEDVGGTDSMTLVTLVVDTSGSVGTFSADIEKAIETIVNACKLHPRVESMMLRIVSFADQTHELMGFTPIKDVGTVPPINCGGMTALFDAAVNAIGAMDAYGKQLYDVDFSVNGAVYILTDGEDNRSTHGPKQVLKVVQGIRTGERMESLTAVLVGINAAYCEQALRTFASQAQLEYMDAGQATPRNLAKLAGFISKSISSTSQRLV